jgi:hypothetical protein
MTKNKKRILLAQETAPPTPPTSARLRRPHKGTTSTLHAMAHYMYRVVVCEERAMQRRVWTSSEIAPTNPCLAHCPVQPTTRRRGKRSRNAGHHRAERIYQWVQLLMPVILVHRLSGGGLWRHSDVMRNQSATQRCLPSCATAGMAWWER